jgi:hypothetical protein
MTPLQKRLISDLQEKCMLILAGTSRQEVIPTQFYSDRGELLALSSRAFIEDEALRVTAEKAYRKVSERWDERFVQKCEGAA